MQKVKNSLKNIVYQETLDGIIRGEYKASQVINEQELVEKFGFSKSPVREALVSLCNEGVLRNIPRYGYEVVRLTRQDVDEMLSFRYILESGMLRRSYREITAAQLEELHCLDNLCNASVDDMWVHWEYNTEFHLKLLSCSGNNYAWQELKRTLDILKRAYAQFYWDKWSAQYNPIDMRYHKEILSCIAEKNIDEALEKLKLDLNDFGGI